MSAQGVKVSNVFNNEVAREWENKGKLIKQVYGCDNPILRELNENLSNGQTILEIGCGTGKLIHYILSNYDECDIVGLDISKDMIEAAEQRKDKINCKNNTVKFIVSDIENCDIKPNTFDVIVLKQVLHHLSNPISALKKVKGFLKPSGSVILMVPGKNYQNEIFPFVDSRNDVLGRFSMEGLEDIILKSSLFPVRLWEERFIFEFENFYNYMNFMSDIGGIQKLFDYDHEKYANVIKLFEIYKKLFLNSNNFYISGEYIVAVCQKKDKWLEFQHYNGIGSEVN